MILGTYLPQTKRARRRLLPYIYSLPYARLCQAGPMPRGINGSARGLNVRTPGTARPSGQAARVTARGGSALFAFFELQLLIAANKAARPAFAGARWLAAVNTLLCYRDLDTAVLAIVYIPFFHFMTFRHDSYLLPRDTAWRL